MNFFDATAISFLNQFAQVSREIDIAILILSGNLLLKGGLLATALWWFWFEERTQFPYHQEKIIAIMLCSLTAISVARLMALGLPFRARPLNEPTLNFTLPYAMEKTVLEGWSSFPSDHAVIFYSISIGLFLISKKTGIVALIYTTIFICLPRIYLGLHYPTDIVAGAIIGTTIGYLGNIYLIRTTIPKSILKWSLVKPKYFYSLFFILTYQTANMFNEVRAILGAVFKIFKKMIM